MAQPALIAEDIHKSFGDLEVLKGLSLTAETGDEVRIEGLVQTANLPNGVDQSVDAAPAYFTFQSLRLLLVRDSEVHINNTHINKGQGSHVYRHRHPTESV